jgi:SAM-dependent methyltransferase
MRRDVNGKSTGETTTGLRRLLSVPSLYNAYDTLVGNPAVRRAFVRDFVRAAPGANVLELGCGTAKLLHYLTDVIYTGIDISEAYIRTAQRRYGSRGRFVVGSVTEADFGPRQSYDVVMAFGLLHHLDDATARLVLSRAHSVLKPGGRLVTLDPCFAENQHRFARYLHRKDRGRHVRYVDGYVSLVRAAFDHVAPRVFHDLHRIPSTTLIMTCA